MAVFSCHMIHIIPFAATGKSCKEKTRKQNFQMCLSLFFLITNLFLKSESLFLFKLNLLVDPIGKKPAPGDHESVIPPFPFYMPLK